MRKTLNIFIMFVVLMFVMSVKNILSNKENRLQTVSASENIVISVNNEIKNNSKYKIYILC